MLYSLVFLEFFVLAAVLDFKDKTVPNFVSVLWAVTGFFAGGGGLPFLVCLFFSAWLWRLCVWGAGDAKFFPGLSLWAGVYLFAWAWVGVFLLSAVLAWVFNRLNSKYVRLCLVPFSLVAFWLMGVAKALGVFGP